MQMSKKLIELNKVSTGYKEKVILKNVTMNIFQNDFIGVIGPNGGGKTTFIKLLLGQLPAYGGSINYFLDKRQTIGYLPQQNQFDKKFPITAIEVVMSGLMTKKGIFGRYTKTDRTKAEEVLEEVGVLHLKDKTIGDLSGGEMQRVFLSRALIASPEILILDEPSTYVDSNYEGELYEKLKVLNERMAIVLVSHDMGIISRHVKSIACINKDFHYHLSNKISKEQLDAYKCPLKLITHGHVPHTVLEEHKH